MATTLLHSTITSTSSEPHSFGLAPVAATPYTQRSPWHSPVPYLFGGLAAMLGLIAFALLILACSYWRLSSEDENEQNDLEKGEGVSKMKNPPVYEEKIVVIMAGDDKPTFLANPVKILLNPIPANPDLSPVGASSVSNDGVDKAKEDEHVQHHN